MNMFQDVSELFVRPTDNDGWKKCVNVQVWGNRPHLGQSYSIESFYGTFKFAISLYGIPPTLNSADHYIFQTCQ